MLKKSTLALAVMTAALAQQSVAAGFIEDSKATLDLRNFYINNDNRDSDTKAAKAQNYQSEWGQGFDLRFTSGFTRGTVGLGVDAISLLGVKLDSSHAKHGNPTGALAGGNVFPTDGDEAVDDFASLGLTAKAKVSQTELRLGTLTPKNPVVVTNDTRLVTQTFQGGQIQSNDIKDLTLTAGQLEHAKGRNSTDEKGLSIAGANGGSDYRKATLSNKFYYGGADYKLTKDLTASYYYGNLKDFYKQNFLGLVHNWSIGPGVLKVTYAISVAAMTAPTTLTPPTTPPGTTRTTPACPRRPKARSTTTCTATWLCTRLKVTPSVVAISTATAKVISLG
jgi:hypothetical protein